MTQADIWRIAKIQSAIDAHCAPEDFDRAENVIVHSAADPRARRYLELPFACDLISYGPNLVASVSPQLEAAVRQYASQYAPAHCFETPNLHVLETSLRPHGYSACFMAEYFLPLLDALAPIRCGYELRVLGPADFAPLYTPQWANALCEARRSLDMLGVGAFDGGRLVGLAGASADCETMWQIGVDVLPGYRRQGIAAALTSRLAAEILARGKVPFYCCAWSNIPSARNAIRSGFRPAWAELTFKPLAYVEKLQQG